MLQRLRKFLIPALSIVLCLFTLAEVNFPQLQSQSQLALFVLLGMSLCFLIYPARESWKDSKLAQATDLVLVLGTVVACGYVIWQSEPLFRASWAYGKSLGDRAGIETNADFAIGIIGLLLVLEATRRSIGWIVPILALLFMAHSLYASRLPDWMLPHAGQDLEYLVSTTWSQSLGVFGPAATVMFKYVFLFVVFGAFLEMSGATQFIIDFSERVFSPANPLLRFVPRAFRGALTAGGPAKVSVLGSGLMGSLSGSAVANAVTTGSFTIPMMRNAGFDRQVAGGITAAAASGGALVPPVMGAGAYMMIELVQPSVKFLDIARAALIPAVLYYLSIFLIVHFYARRAGAGDVAAAEAKAGQQVRKVSKFQGLVFFAALGALVTFLVLGFTAFKAVSGALVVILVLAMFSPHLKLPTSARAQGLAAFAVATAAWLVLFTEPPPVPKLRLHVQNVIDASLIGMFALIVYGIVQPRLREEFLTALQKSAKNGVALVSAAACVGIIIGVVQSTGIATDFSTVIKGVVESSLLLALIGIMVCSIILGMGVPSVVCYLLMATLMGSLLEELGVQPLAAHLFIFYFGMMSMVTPPVALAAYASASIAGARIMPTAWASFRFALVGFTLPFMFIYRPALLLLEKKDPANRSSINRALDLTDKGNLVEVALAAGTAVLGIYALAAAIAGFLKGPLSWPARAVLLVSAALLLSPEMTIDGTDYGMAANGVAAGLLVVVLVINWRLAAARHVPPSDATAG